MRGFGRELAHALRGLLRTPGFAAAAILTLALGIGANCAIYSVVNGIIYRPIPTPEANRLVFLCLQNGKTQAGITYFSYADFADVEAQTRDLFRGMSAVTVGLDGLAGGQRSADPGLGGPRVGASISGTPAASGLGPAPIEASGHRPQRILTWYVTGNYFSMMGLQPALGTFFRPGQGTVAGADPQVVLGYDYWRTRYAADRAILGRTLDVDGRPFTVIGVAPRGFRGTMNLADGEAYMPLAMGIVTEPGTIPARMMTDRGQRFLFVLGDLRPGVSLAQVQSEMDVVSRRLAAAHPKEDSGLNIRAFWNRDVPSGPDPNFFLQRIALLFLALAGVVLLLACVNVANLQLVRVTGRSQEMAIRAAMGAPRWRLVRQLLLESLLLAAAGGGAGLLLGVAASREISRLPLATSLPVHLDFGLDPGVFLYSLLIAAAAGVVSGIIPALRASRTDIQRLLRTANRGRSGSRQWLRSTLVASQVAGSLALLIIAGLFTRSLGRARTADLGFDPNHVMEFAVDPNLVGFSQDRAEQFYKELLPRLRALPGVVAAGAATNTPFGAYLASDVVNVPGFVVAPGQSPPAVAFTMITPGVLDTLRIPVIEGRDVRDADQHDTQFVAVINQAMAKKYWPGEDPLGRTFTMNLQLAHTIQVVGLVPDSATSSINQIHIPYFYLPLSQFWASMNTLVIRTRGPAESVTQPVETLLAQLAPGMPVMDVETMPQQLNGLNGFLIYALGAGLALALGLLGLVLAVVGVYGIIAYTTAQRTNEIGVRLALGAEPARIVRMILRQGLAIVLVGMAVGLVIAVAAGRLASSFLVGVGGADPATFLGISALLGGAAALACYLPARRALGVNPSQALRE